MQEHNWLVSVVRELSAYAENKQVTGMLEGLQQVLIQYALEAELDEAERVALLKNLRDSAENA